MLARQADSRKPWVPEWIARVRFRFSTMIVPGKEEATGARRGQATKRWASHLSSPSASARASKALPSVPQACASEQKTSVAGNRLSRKRNCGSLAKATRQPCDGSLRTPLKWINPSFRRERRCWRRPCRADCRIVARHPFLGVMFAFELNWAKWPFALVLAAERCWRSVGVFIVCHDAMHGSLIPGRGRLNGVICAVPLALYVGFAKW